MTWKIKNLDEIAEVRIGYPTPKNKNFFKDGVYDFIKTSDVGKIKIGSIKSSLNKLNDIGIKKFQPFKKGTILFPKRGVSTILNHRVVMERDGYIASTLAGIKANENLIYDKYLFYFLLTVDTKKLIPPSAYPGMNLNQIYKIKISFPPLLEQQSVVLKLDASFAEIDKVIATTELKLHCLDTIFEKVLNDSTQRMAVNVKLGEVCDIQGKLISPIDKPYCNELHIGAGNIVSMSNKLTNVLSAKEEGLISGKFPFGTDSVLYSKIRPYLRKVHLPKHSGICSADIYPLIPNTKRLDRNYLYYLLLSQNFTNYAMSGSARAGMPKVNRNHLFDYEFCLPEIEVQKLAAKKIEAVYSNVSNFKHIGTQKISQFHSLKSAILKQELKSEAA